MRLGNSVVYPKSVTRGLQEEGFLTTSLVTDPIQNPGYMIYLCEDGQAYAISATKERPTAQGISLIQKTCNGVDPNNGTYTKYGKNYSVSNSFLIKVIAE